MATRTFEVFYHDLNDDCKARYLAFNKVSDIEEINGDVSPLAMIDLEDMDESEAQS
jgi:hypothetical protein